MLWNKGFPEWVFGGQHEKVQSKHCGIHDEEKNV
jgi:hypothetical protein